jgi:hypothetical protein
MQLALHVDNHGPASLNVWRDTWFMTTYNLGKYPTQTLLLTAPMGFVKKRRLVPDRSPPDA